MKRIALAFLGQALPEERQLQKNLHYAKRGLLATIVTGVLLSALLVFLCYGLYLFLKMQGVSPLISMGLGASFLLFLVIISGLVADRNFSKLENLKEDLSLFPQQQQPFSSDVDISALLQSFWDGLTTPAATTHSPSTRENSADDPTARDKSRYSPRHSL